MADEGFGQGGVYVSDNGTGDGVTFGARFLQDGAPLIDQVDWRTRRPHIEFDLARGNWEVTVEQPLTAEVGPDNNTEYVNFRISLGDWNGFISYVYDRGIYGTAGEIFRSFTFPNGTTHLMDNHGLPQANLGRRFQESFQNNTYTFTLPDPNRVYFESFRYVGNLRMNGRRTDASGLAAFSLPPRVTRPSRNVRRFEFSRESGNFAASMVVVASYLG